MDAFNNAGTWTIIAIAVILLLGWLVKGKWPGTATALADQLQRAEELAQIAVGGVQQLYESGQLEDVERYDEVEDFLGEIFPDLNADQLRMVIESAVWWHKRAREDRAYVRTVTE